MATITATPVVGEKTFTKGPGPYPQRIRFSAEVTSKAAVAYTSKDALGDLIKIPLSGFNVNACVLHLVRCTTNKAIGSNGVLTNYYTDVITAVADNSPFTLSFTENLNRVGSNQIAIGNDYITSGSMGFSAGIDMDIVLPSGNDLYVQPVIIGTPTPDAGQKWQFEFTICCW